MAVKAKTIQIDHFIDGEFVQSGSGANFESINPATGEVLAHVSRGDVSDVDLAVKSARKAFDHGPWPGMSIRQRCEVLRRIGDLILERKEELARAESADTGKPIAESLNGDIPRSALNFHFFADYAQSISEDCFTVDSRERHIGVREPAGVAALITPWNLPLYLATWKIAPALAMGNTCVLKPAEWTPYSAYLLADIARAAGLPSGVLNIVQGFGAGEAGEELTRHPGVDCISFTGETTTGKAIMTAAAQSLKKISFELGGKGANIIFADANLDEALPASVRAAYRNQGQICLAGSRLLVHKSIFDRVVDKVVETVKRIKVGDPMSPETEMGAIISSEQLAKVESYIKLGRDEGELLTGGKRVESLRPGNFLEPAVFVGIKNESRFCQEEIFGPVLPIIPFESEDEAVAMANNSAYGLSASVWSSDVNVCHRVSSGLKSGIVWVNCWFARDLRTPFGGQKKSGIGREGGRYSLEFFSEAKAICYRYD